jgi:dipeptidase E
MPLGQPPLEVMAVAPDLFLLSSSSVHGYAPFEHALSALAEHVGDARAILFAPFAVANHDAYTERTQRWLDPLGVPVTGLHAVDDPRRAVEEAEVLFIGGGNSFRLLAALWRLRLIEPIRRRALAGELRFVGSSAGTNMACPSLRTTNDMPIVQPASFEALGLVPFQINPHYVDADLSSTHRGETREDRLCEFLEENDVAVLGLREGSWLWRRGDSLTLHGVAGARLFQRGAEPRPFEPGADLSTLLTLEPRFDTPAS